MAFILFVAITVSVFLSARIFEGLEPSELGLKLDRETPKQFLFGLLFSFSVLALQFLLYWSLGLVKVNGFAWQSESFSAFLWNLLLAFLIPLLASWSYELLFRGYYLRILTDGFGRLNAVLLTTVLFAYLPFILFTVAGTFLIGIFVFYFLFGLLMIFAFFRTGQLWLPIGIHAGWSFFGGAIFSDTFMFSVNRFQLIDMSSLVTTRIELVTNLVGLAVIAILVRTYASRGQVNFQARQSDISRTA